MRNLGGLPYYNAFLYSTNYSSGFHIYISPLISNRDTIICDLWEFILRVSFFYIYYLLSTQFLIYSLGVYPVEALKSFEK